VLQASSSQYSTVPCRPSVKEGNLAAGRDVCYTRHRSQWSEKIPEAGTRRRAEQLYQQLDMVQHLCQQARRGLLAESRKHPITAKLRQIPSLGPIRSALAVALIQTPHRFRTTHFAISLSEGPDCVN
jgi:hypothetical protein